MQESKMDYMIIHDVKVNLDENHTIAKLSEDIDEQFMKIVAFNKCIPRITEDVWNRLLDCEKASIGTIARGEKLYGNKAINYCDGTKWDVILSQ